MAEFNFLAFSKSCSICRRFFSIPAINLARVRPPFDFSYIMMHCRVQMTERQIFREMGRANLKKRNMKPFDFDDYRSSVA
jgi:hypothetical protein